MNHIDLQAAIEAAVRGDPGPGSRPRPASMLRMKEFGLQGVKGLWTRQMEHVALLDAAALIYQFLGCQAVLERFLVPGTFEAELSGTEIGSWMREIAERAKRDADIRSSPAPDPLALLPEVLKEWMALDSAWTGGEQDETYAAFDRRYEGTLDGEASQRGKWELRETRIKVQLMTCAELAGIAMEQRRMFWENEALRAAAEKRVAEAEADKNRALGKVWEEREARARAKRALEEEKEARKRAEDEARIWRTMAQDILPNLVTRQQFDQAVGETKTGLEELRFGVAQTTAVSEKTFEALSGHQDEFAKDAGWVESFRMLKNKTNAGTNKWVAADGEDGVLQVCINKGLLGPMKVENLVKYFDGWEALGCPSLEEYQAIHKANGRRPTTGDAPRIRKMMQAET